MSSWRAYDLRKGTIFFSQCPRALQLKAVLLVLLVYRSQIFFDVAEVRSACALVECLRCFARIFGRSIEMLVVNSRLRSRTIVCECSLAESSSDLKNEAKTFSRFTATISYVVLLALHFVLSRSQHLVSWAGA